MVKEGGGFSGSCRFMLENITREQRKLAPEVDCKLGVNGLTRPENQRKGGKQGTENQSLLFNTGEEST